MKEGRADSLDILKLLTNHLILNAGSLTSLKTHQLRVSLLTSLPKYKNLSSSPTVAKDTGEMARTAAVALALLGSLALALAAPGLPMKCADWAGPELCNTDADGITTVAVNADGGGGKSQAPAPPCLVCLLHTLFS